MDYTDALSTDFSYNRYSLSVDKVMAVKIVEFLGINAHGLSLSDSRLANKFCPYIGKTCKKINRELEQKPMCTVESSGGVADCL